VNSHHHVQVFPPVGRILLDVLGDCNPLPYVRRVREPWRVLAAGPGAWAKRTLLNVLGRRASARQAHFGFSRHAWRGGVTDPACVKDPASLARWLRRVPGETVELTCHPGHPDETLLGRDATLADGQMQRRVDEFHLLSQPSFQEACRGARFKRITPCEW